MKVVVCGAGIAGLAAAGRFAARGDEVVVLERAPGPRPQGYMIDFFGPGHQAAAATGLLPLLRERGYQVREVAYLDAAGRRRAGLPFARFAASRGGDLISIMRPDLEAALAEHLPDRVDLRYGATVVTVDDDEDGARVVLDDGAAVEADLVVGADGTRSVVRRQVVGPDRGVVRRLGFHTAAFTVDEPRVHAALRGRFCVTDTANRMVGAYGLRDGRVAVFTVHRSTDGQPADPRAALRAEYGGLGWVVPRVLELCPPGERVYYDEVVQVEAARWRGRRVVLVGDAAHAVSLLAGQGASLAVAGASVLADRLDATRSVADGLAEYEARWRPVVTAVQRSARRGMRWFLPETPGQLLVRRMALRLAVLPVVNRVVVGVAAGSPVDLDAVLADRTASATGVRT
ncbi:FAD-dependent monooxygenase [Pseudonocardia humida]|uniref:FAD-dependent monooxygenase n=1 Tax=Pseudonocardia humida TaxID=2800819 RepID=A0ABT0ZXR3_9PSEU|nr:FAD-dependent monooxygenase [Pseudonocardia humida]MCO1655528.1 FAD-dependent monooxygenase [Pseudonocardia humida]